MTSLQTLTLVTVVLGVVGGSGAGRTTPPTPHTLEEAAHRMDMILNNTRSRENYIRCFMDRGICNKEATSIKRILSDALATNCSNCTQIQKMGVEKFFKYLQTHQPETWVSLSEKYKAGGGGGDGASGKDKKNHHHDDDDDEEDDDDEGGNKKHKKGKMDQPAGGNGKNNTNIQHTTGGEKKNNETSVTTTDISIIF